MNHGTINIDFIFFKRGGYNNTNTKITYKINKQDMISSYY